MTQSNFDVDSCFDVVHLSDLTVVVRGTCESKTTTTTRSQSQSLHSDASIRSTIDENTVEKPAQQWKITFDGIIQPMDCPSSNCINGNVHDEDEYIKLWTWSSYDDSNNNLCFWNIFILCICGSFGLYIPKLARKVYQNMTFWITKCWNEMNRIPILRTTLLLRGKKFSL